MVAMSMQDMFEIADETRGYMKSCKLDKSREGYVQGKCKYI